MIEMNAFGLIQHWIISNRANPHQCLKQNFAEAIDQSPTVVQKPDGRIRCPFVRLERFAFGFLCRAAVRYASASR